MKLSLTLKHISIKTLKLLNIKKMKLFKTSHSVMMSHDLELTSLMLFKKCFNENVFRNKIKKAKIMLDEIEKVLKTISIKKKI